MSELDQIKDAFSKKLEQHKQESQAKLAQDLQTVRAFYATEKEANPEQLGRQLEQRSAELEGAFQVSPGAQAPSSTRPIFQTIEEDQPQAPAVNQQVMLNGSQLFDRLDSAFFSAFNLDKFFSREGLLYPTVYTESLEEFFSPWLNSMDASERMRKEYLIHKVKEAQAQANHGGTYGYNLSGKGCYLNGWLFAYPAQIPPRAALSHPAILPSIIGTTAHEKLGHGFLSVYSALGKVKSDLDLEMTELASRFGLRPAEDPLSKIRLEQHNLIFKASNLLEEGWSTWIEAMVSQQISVSGVGGLTSDKGYTLKRLIETVQQLPYALQLQPPGKLLEFYKIHKELLMCLNILFSPNSAPTQGQLLSAVRIFKAHGRTLEEYFSQQFRQSLPYVLGYLLFKQAETRLGIDLMPYIALIAANVSMDFSQMGMVDLEHLLETDPRLHPDARLAALSQLELQQKNSVRELAQLAENKLSFSVPAALKKG